MGKIRVLGEGLINRIAAGEVVERPASVVKELIENSLDAGAERIEIHLEAGGKRMISVTDDGFGMDRDDALLALERHATSKLQRFEDLDAISTLGFRGEALPSIAAVSRLLLHTVPETGDGSEIECRGGRIIDVRAAAGTRGTRIDVGSLFFNVPARRKFLRSEATELSHAIRWVTRCALAHPRVRFRLSHDARTLLDLPPSENRSERTAEVLGREQSRRMLHFAAETKAFRIEGFGSRPAEALPRRDTQHLFVNGRAVQDRTLLHAIAEAYADSMPRDRYPAIILFLEVEPGRVDVNVHPQKTEVRFTGSFEIHDAVRDAIRAVLGGGTSVPSWSDLRGEIPARVAEATTAFLANAARLDLAAGSAASPERPCTNEASEAGPILVDERDRAVPLAQLHGSYILAEDREGLIIVDQHAAHERVLFEAYLAAAETQQVPTQKLLFPMVIDLPLQERVLLEEQIEEFRRLGFEIDAIGDGTFRLDAVPALAAALDPEAILRALLDTVRQARTATTSVEPIRRRLVTTAACHAAIKIHQPLAAEQMRRLLDDLARTTNPTTCPHGRPVLFRLTITEVERTFRRR